MCAWFRSSRRPTMLGCAWNACSTPDLALLRRFAFGGLAFTLSLSAESESLIRGNGQVTRAGFRGFAWTGPRQRSSSGALGGASTSSSACSGRSWASLQLSSCTRSAKNSQIARAAAIVGSASRTPADAVQLAAREQAEDDEERMEPERARHHVRHHDVALDLVDEDEERQHPERRHGVDDESVDRGWNRRQPGADVRDHLDHRGPDAEEECVAIGPGNEAGAPEQPHPDPGAEADHGRQDQLPAHVAGERLLDPKRQRQALARREPAIDRRARAAPCRAACRWR